MNEVGAAQRHTIEALLAVTLQACISIVPLLSMAPPICECTAPLKGQLSHLKRNTLGDTTHKRQRLAGTATHMLSLIGPDDARVQLHHAVICDGTTNLRVAPYD